MENQPRQPGYKDKGGLEIEAFHLKAVTLGSQRLLIRGGWQVTRPEAGNGDDGQGGPAWGSIADMEVRFEHPKKKLDWTSWIRSGLLPTMTELERLEMGQNDDQNRRRTIGYVS